MLETALLTSAMQRALFLARRGPATSESNPNPQVGCVLLRPDGRIVAEGWHMGAGTPHAEVAALAALPAEWARRASELTAVVTLEPCNHTGRTGPCAKALLAAGVGAVAFALGDPGECEGGGAARLAAAGVEVLGGVLAGEARELLAPWFAARGAADVSAHGAADVAGESGSDAPLDSLQSAALHRLYQPHVTVKWAQTLDGRIAAADGTSQWITGPLAREHVHRERALADAIIVGTGTLYADNPSLTARTPRGELLVPASEQPIPVVFGEREIPADAAIRQHPALAAHGLTAPLQFDGRDIAGALSKLAARGVRRVFVEGGASVITEFFRAGAVDEVLCYVAGSLLGTGPLAVRDFGCHTLAARVQLRVKERVALGPDTLLRAVTLGSSAQLSAEETAAWAVTSAGQDPGKTAAQATQPARAQTDEQTTAPAGESE